MTETSLACPDCQHEYDRTDNYCRNCGMFLAASKDLAVVDRSRALPARENRPPAIPTPVKRAVAAVAVGAAVQIGVSLAGKYLLKQAARQALTLPVRGRGVRPQEAPARNGTAADLPDDVTAVNETVIVHRAWIRR